MTQTGDDATIIQAVEMIGNDAIVLGSIPVTGKGTYRISFQPTGSSVQLWVLGAYDMQLKPTCYTYPVTTQETYLVDICDENKDRYRFGFNGMEKDNELKGIGNSLDFGARMYDSRIGRWLSVNPDYKKFPAFSGYMGMNNCPISVDDKSGRGGEAVFDGKTITLYMDMVFYGTSLSPTKENSIALANQKASDLMAAVNGRGLTMKGPDGNDYPLSLKVTAKVQNESDVFESAKANVGEKFNARLNFNRIENLDNVGYKGRNTTLNQLATSGHTPIRGQVSNLTGDNSVIMLTKYLNTTAFIYEWFAHALGSRSSNYEAHISNIGATQMPPFSIRTTVQTKGVNPSFTIEDIKTGACVLDEKYRAVIQEDIDKLTVGSWSENKDGTKSVQVGNATNGYFDAKGKQYNTQNSNVTYDSTTQN